jgi:hypothetical protein
VKMPATCSLIGTPNRLNVRNAGANDPAKRLAAHAVRNAGTVSRTPDSSASITTGRPSHVAVSRPANVSLGTYPCPASGFS